MREVVSRLLGGKLRSFRVLYRVFLFRVVDVELLSADGDTVKLLGQFASVLAGISFALTAWLVLAGRLPTTVLWTMEHLLIATTMLVVGVLAVLSWDSTFPDRRDVLVLGPLPVRTGVLFSAKLAASASALGLAIVALNSISGVIWPLLFIPEHAGVGGVARSVLAYWIAMAAAGLFMFGMVLSVQWILGQTLPRQMFLRLAPVFQVGLLGLFVGTYFAEPSLASPGAVLAPENQVLLRWLPTYWFFGFFQQLNGSGDPAFGVLATRAWMGLGVAVVGAGLAVLLSYVRTLRKTIEEPDILPGAKRLHWSLRLGGGLQTAVAMFSARTFARSRQHRFLLTLYLGIGFGVITAYVKTPMAEQERGSTVAAPYLAASLLFLVFAVTGVRAVFSMPIALKANWVFQTTERATAAAYGRVSRRTLLLLGYAPALTALGVWFLTIWPLRAAFEHVLVLALVGAILCEVSVYGFDKIPFTCSYLPGKGNVPAYFWGFLLLLLPVTNKAAEMEIYALGRGSRYAAMVLCLAAVWLMVRWRTTAAMNRLRGLRFEEAMPPELVALGLDSGKVAALKDRAG